MDKDRLIDETLEKLLGLDTSPTAVIPAGPARAILADFAATLLADVQNGLIDRAWEFVFLTTPPSQRAGVLQTRDAFLNRLDRLREASKVQPTGEGA